MNEEHVSEARDGLLHRLHRRADGWIERDSVALPPVRRSWVARAVLIAGIAAYLWVYMSWTLANYDNFVAIGGGGYDFSIHDQGVWLLSRLHSPFLTISGTQYFADHLSFIMLLLVPLYWLFSTGKVLLVLQALALGLAAFPAFLVARQRLRSEVLAAAIAVAYLVNPYIGYTNLESFHPDVFAVPLVFLAFWFVLRRRWVPFFVSIVLMLLVKEDVPLLVMGLGIWVGIRYHRRLGLLTVVLGAVWLFVSYRFLLPFFNGAGGLATYVARHGERIPFGGIGGFVKTLVTRPWRVVGQALGPHRPWYYLQVFGPVAFLSFLSPLALVLLSASASRQRPQHVPVPVPDRIPLRDAGGARGVRRGHLRDRPLQAAAGSAKRSWPFCSHARCSPPGSGDRCRTPGTPWPGITPVPHTAGPWMPP